MATRGEGHLLFQADSNKQLCNKCIINEKLIIPVYKHFNHLVPIMASGLPGSQTPHLSLSSGNTLGGGGAAGRAEAA